MRVVIATRGPDARAAERLLRAAGHEVVQGDGPQGADLMLVDEWTAETAPHVQAARRLGVATTVLADLILDAHPGPVIGVTGTAGKTSTCRAIAHVLRAAGAAVTISETARSGNAWPDHSLARMPNAPPVADDTVLVAELTSTHLCFMRPVRPDVAVVTAIRPDHLELHGSLDAYVAAKRRLVEGQQPQDAVVVPGDDPTTTDFLGPLRARPWLFGAHDAATDGCFRHGDGVLLRSGSTEVHARVHLPVAPLDRAALAAGATALALGHPPGAIEPALATLPAPPHRMNARPGPRGIRLIDDTMAATPLKGAAAVRATAADHPVIVVGGDDAPNGSPVHASDVEARGLATALGEVRAAARYVVAFGPAAARVREHITPDAEVPDVSAALAAALRETPDGGTVLVSPMFPMTPAERLIVAGDPRATPSG